MKRTFSTREAPKDKEYTQAQVNSYIIKALKSLRNGQEQLLQQITSLKENLFQGTDASASECGEDSQESDQ